MAKQASFYAQRSIAASARPATSLTCHDVLATKALDTCLMRTTVLPDAASKQTPAPLSRVQVYDSIFSMFACCVSMPVASASTATA